MVPRTNFLEKMSEDELAFFLAFEANEEDEKLVAARDDLYFGAAFTNDVWLQEKAMSLATRLETVIVHNQARLNRRYNHIQARGVN